eukprot:924939-Pelagomonas_calceolata.AAC.1
MAGPTPWSNWVIPGSGNGAHPEHNAGAGDEHIRMPASRGQHKHSRACVAVAGAPVAQRFLRPSPSSKPAARLATLHQRRPKNSEQSPRDGQPENNAAKD